MEVEKREEKGNNKPNRKTGRKKAIRNQTERKRRKWL
jgi:hypothetical protein